MLFVVGESNSKNNFPWVQSSNPDAYYDTITYSFDGFISKFNTLSIYGIESSTTINNSIIVYPNPASTTLYIKSDKEINSYKIYNLTGQLIKTGEYNNGIPITELPAGIYLLNINIANKSRSFKFVRE